jgi:hypothetical protein
MDDYEFEKYRKNYLKRANELYNSDPHIIKKANKKFNKEFNVKDEYKLIRNHWGKPDWIFKHFTTNGVYMKEHFDHFGCVETYNNSYVLIVSPYYNCDNYFAKLGFRKYDKLYHLEAETYIKEVRENDVAL